MSGLAMAWSVFSKGIVEDIRALPVPNHVPAWRPKVKGLVWVPGEHGRPDIAESVLGNYSAWEIQGHAFYMYPGQGFGGGIAAGATLEAAKAAAQADYEARILSALDAPEPAPAPAWRDIALAPRDRTRILLFAQGPHGPHDVYFGVGEWANADPDLTWSTSGWFWEFAIRPTHWMPLPPPPQTGGHDDA